MIKNKPLAIKVLIFYCFLVFACACQIEEQHICHEATPDKFESNTQNTGDSLGSSSKPNVLMIILDDWGYNIGALGGQAITPNIDKLVSEGVTFENAYCAIQACNPSRTALLTGLSPLKSGVIDNATYFRDIEKNSDLVTLPGHFKANGYDTFAAGKIFHLHRGNGKIPFKASDSQSWDRQRIGNIGTPVGDGWWGSLNIPSEETEDYKSATFIIEKLGCQRKKPFFGALGFYRPHDPWFVPKQFFELYDTSLFVIGDTTKEDLNDVHPKYRGTGARPRKGFEYLSSRNQIRSGMQAYFASISFADEQVGRVMEALDSSKYAKNTLVILMGDHGFLLGEKRFWGKDVLWRKSTRVPMIFRFPNSIVGGTVCKRVVSLLDIFPTLIDFCKLPKKEELNGRSIYPLLKNPNQSWSFPVVSQQWRDNFSLMTENYNYIRYANGFEELYDFIADPKETTNLAQIQTYDDLKKKMRKLLETNLNLLKEES